MSLCFHKHGASGLLIHQGPSKGLNDPRWRGVGRVVSTKVGGGRGGACHQGGVGPWALCLFRGGLLRVVSGLVARPTYYITSWLALLY